MKNTESRWVLGHQSSTLHSRPIESYADGFIFMPGQNQSFAIP